MTLFEEKKQLRADLKNIYRIREAAKTPAGRLSDFGNALVMLWLEHGHKQIHIAKILDVSPSAISQIAKKA
jgi:DNA-directed RNA polymerase specialized sigma subunit